MSTRTWLDVASDWLAGDFVRRGANQAFSADQQAVLEELMRQSFMMLAKELGNMVGDRLANVQAEIQKIKDGRDLVEESVAATRHSEEAATLVPSKARSRRLRRRRCENRHRYSRDLILQAREPDVPRELRCNFRSTSGNTGCDSQFSDIDQDAALGRKVHHQATLETYDDYKEKLSVEVSSIILQLQERLQICESALGYLPLEWSTPSDVSIPFLVWYGSCVPAWHLACQCQSVSLIQKVWRGYRIRSSIALPAKHSSTGASSSMSQEIVVPDEGHLFASDLRGDWRGLPSQAWQKIHSLFSCNKTSILIKVQRSAMFRVLRAWRQHIDLHHDELEEEIAVSIISSSKVIFCISGPAGSKDLQCLSTACKSVRNMILEAFDDLMHRNEQIADQHRREILFIDEKDLAAIRAVSYRHSLLQCAH